jgi:hypothetical protein
MMLLVIIGGESVGDIGIGERILLKINLEKYVVNICARFL